MGLFNYGNTGCGNFKWGYQILSPMMATLMLKLSRNKKGLNDVTAAPFLVSFFFSYQLQKNTKNGAAVTSSDEPEPEFSSLSRAGALKFPS